MEVIKLQAARWRSP